jgi:UDP-glucose 4-epimerase
MKVAIFGANGYVGRHLVHYISSKTSWHVTAFDLQEKFTGLEDIEYFSLDISDKSQISKCGNFDQVYFLAALSGTATSFQNYADFIRINEVGLINILDHFNKSRVRPKIIFPSTRLIYKGTEGVALSEDAEKECKTIYASSKYNGELYLKMYRNLYGLDYTVFRICVPYGHVVDGQMSYGTVGFFLGKANSGKPIILYGNGCLKRTFTHILDVCHQMVRTSSLPESSGECFNIDGETYSLLDVAQMISKKFDVPVQFTEWPVVDLKLESGDTIFNATKIKSILPFTLTHSLATWIRN